MPFVPQSVELTDRIRRAFGMRGQLAVAVDEVAVPTIQLFDASQSPYRTQGIRWWMNATQSAPAGQLPMISVVAAQPGTVVIDRVYAHITTTTAVLALAWGTDAWFPPNGAQSSEVTGFDPANPANLPIRLVVATVASPYAGATPFWAHRIPQFAPAMVEVDQPITQAPTAPPVVTSLRMLNLTAAGDLTVSVTGRYFPTNP